MQSETTRLVAMARGDVTASPALETGPFDWEKFRDAASRHQVDALCAWFLLEAGRDRESVRLKIPKATHQRLSTALHAQRFRNQTLLRILDTLANALAKRGVDALVFKGPWLAFQAYPDPGTRSIGDIDLCVREENYVPAIEAIAECGYRTTDTLPARPQQALEQSHYNRQLRFTSRSSLPLELHFRMINFGPPSSGESWIWKTARRLPGVGESIGVPGPEAMLLHLLLHANQHGFTKLRLLHDIRFCLDRDAESFDIDLFLRKARPLRCGAALYHALMLAEALAGAPTGSTLPRILRPSLVRRQLYRALWTLPTAARLDVPQRPLEFEAPRLYLLEMGRLRDKAQYASAIMRQSGGLLPMIDRVRKLGAFGSSLS